MSDVIDYRLAVTQESLFSGSGSQSWVDGPLALASLSSQILTKHSGNPPNKFMKHVNKKEKICY